MRKRLSTYSRLDFLKFLTTAVGGLTISPALGKNFISRKQGDVLLEPPVAIASGFNGERAVQKAVEIMQNGGEVLDGIIQGVNIQEADPDDMSVGYGGLPNEHGVVQLDAAVMHGPSHTAGSVGAIENIKHPSSVAKLVMERTDHVLLVGDGAKRFAKLHGFKEENLLTDRARENWLKWKENLSDDDDYIPAYDPENSSFGSDLNEYQIHYGTIHCSGMDAQRNLSSVTTTSGLSYKIPGRVGDSPIIGAGLYTDNEVGSAGSTGRGEENLKNLSAFFIVERMRMGDSPEEACLAACQRIADHARVPRLLGEDGDPNFNVRFYAINKEGRVGGAELRRTNRQMVAANPQGLHWIDMAYLLS